MTTAGFDDNGNVLIFYGNGEQLCMSPECVLNTWNKLIKLQGDYAALERRLNHCEPARWISEVIKKLDEFGSSDDGAEYAHAAAMLRRYLPKDL